MNTYKGPPFVAGEIVCPARIRASKLARVVDLGDGKTIDDDGKVHVSFIGDGWPCAYDPDDLERSVNDEVQRSSEALPEGMFSCPSCERALAARPSWQKGEPRCHIHGEPRTIHVGPCTNEAPPEGFAERLLAIWSEAQDVALNHCDFPAWDGATKDMLLGLGLEWDGENDCYYLDAAVAKQRSEAAVRAQRLDKATTTKMVTCPRCEAHWPERVDNPRVYIDEKHNISVTVASDKDVEQLKVLLGLVAEREREGARQIIVQLNQRYMEALGVEQQDALPSNTEDDDPGNVIFRSGAMYGLATRASRVLRDEDVDMLKRVARSLARACPARCRFQPQHGRGLSTR